MLNAAAIRRRTAGRLGRGGGPMLAGSQAFFSQPSMLVEVPNIAEFTPIGPCPIPRRDVGEADGALAAFAGLSPGEHSSGSPVRRPGTISRIGSERVRSTPFMCALSAKRTNKAPAAFVQRMAEAGKPPKVILVAVAREPLVYAHAVIRTRKPFQPRPDAPSPP